MTRTRKSASPVVVAGVLAVLLVAALDLLTNSIDTTKFSWDFRYYIDMASSGFGAAMASPFAYRYLTAFLAGGVSRLLDLPVASGFRLLAWLGAVTQLVGVFLFSRWLSKSERGAWVAMLAAALSVFSVKFLLFDTFRPDHLAFPLILLQAYFALTGRFVPLLLSTVIGTQIREFNAVPLLAYVYASLQMPAENGGSSGRRKASAQGLISILTLGAALAIPRLLIPVAADFQFVNLTREGMLRAVLAPFILVRDVNFAFSIIGYALPALMLGSPHDLMAVARALPRRDFSFLAAYSLLVLLLSLYGGTDFFRFSVYLLVPQAITVAVLAGKRPAFQLGVMLVSVLVFNRIWLPIPMSTLNAYLDFYGGYGTRFNLASALRWAECTGFLVLGWACRRISMPGNGLLPPTTQ